VQDFPRSCYWQQSRADKRSSIQGIKASTIHPSQCIQSSSPRIASSNSTVLHVLTLEFFNDRFWLTPLRKEQFGRIRAALVRDGVVVSCACAYMSAAGQARRTKCISDGSKSIAVNDICCSCGFVHGACESVVGHSADGTNQETIRALNEQACIKKGGRA